MRAPKYNRCDYCGRNAHKVAVRRPAYGRHLPTAMTVVGYCPSCFASCFEPTRYGDDPRSNVERWIESGKITVLYDRRGAAQRKKFPVPEELRPA